MERSSPCRFQVDLKGTSTETYSTNLDLQVLLKHLHQDIPPKKHNDAGRLMKNKRLTKLYVTLLVLLWDLTFAESSKDNTVMASPHSSINCMRSARCTHTSTEVNTRWDAAVNPAWPLRICSCSGSDQVPQKQGAESDGDALVSWAVAVMLNKCSGRQDMDVDELVR